jgi:hypothetical protein
LPKSKFYDRLFHLFFSLGGKTEPAGIFVSCLLEHLLIKQIKAWGVKKKANKLVNTKIKVPEY